jgi:hypothetical protein
MNGKLTNPKKRNTKRRKKRPLKVVRLPLLMVMLEKERAKNEHFRDDIIEGCLLQFLRLCEG